MSPSEGNFPSQETPLLQFPAPHGLPESEVRILRHESSCLLYRTEDSD